MLESECTLSIPLIDGTPIRAKAGLTIVIIVALVTKTPAHSVGMIMIFFYKYHFMVTHGLPPRLDIDRFHVPCLILELHPAITVQ
jgi:hypothetical protein